MAFIPGEFMLVSGWTHDWDAPSSKILKQWQRAQVRNYSARGFQEHKLSDH